MLQLYNKEAHKYFFIASFILFIIFLLYVYFCEHKRGIVDNDLWEEAFLKAGFTETELDNIVHDDSLWYYRQGRHPISSDENNSKYYPTCVAYSSNFKDKCSPYEHYCAGDETYGDPIQQAKAVKKAVENGGEHVLCPLIYPGVN